MLAASSKPRAMCSTTWLGDHFPGARGVVQVVADLSAAATRSRTAARWAASTSLISAMGPPVRETVIDLHEPANALRIRVARVRINHLGPQKAAKQFCVELSRHGVTLEFK